MELFGMEIQKRQDAYQLLALALRESRGLTRMPELDRRPGGKPYFPHEEGLEFNLSTAGIWPSALWITPRSEQTSRWSESGGPDCPPGSVVRKSWPGWKGSRTGGGPFPCYGH